jgi:hypothetical protein
VVVAIALDRSADRTEERSIDATADRHGAPGDFGAGAQEQVAADHHYVALHAAGEIRRPTEHEEVRRDDAVSREVEPAGAGHQRVRL